LLVVIVNIQFVSTLQEKHKQKEDNASDSLYIMSVTLSHQNIQPFNSIKYLLKNIINILYWKSCLPFDFLWLSLDEQHDTEWTICWCQFPPRFQSPVAEQDRPQMCQFLVSSHSLHNIKAGNKFTLSE